MIDSSAKGHLKSLHLLAGEEIIAAVVGRRGKRFVTSGRDRAIVGALALTSQRILFIRNGFLADVFESIPLIKVSSLEVDEGMLINHKIFINTSEDKIEFLALCEKKTLRSLIDAFERLRTKDRVQSSPSNETHVAALVQLAELRASGVLTVEEFERAKAALLAKLA